MCNRTLLSLLVSVGFEEMESIRYFKMRNQSVVMSLSRQTTGGISVFLEHHGGDISVFPVRLQGRHKCLPVNTTGGTQVSSRSNDRGTPTFFLCFSLSLTEGRGDAWIKKINLRKPTRKINKSFGEKSFHVDTQKSKYHILQNSPNFHLSIMLVLRQNDNNYRNGRFKNHS